MTDLKTPVIQKCTITKITKGSYNRRVGGGPIELIQGVRLQFLMMFVGGVLLDVFRYFFGDFSQ